MLFSYNRPTGITWAISGTGAAFLTDSAALCNGMPADVTRLRWLSAGSPATTDNVVLTGTLGTTIKARSAALLMPNLATAIPAGVKVTCAGKLSGGAVALGGDALTQRTVRLPNGASARPWVFPAVSIDTIVITIYNDNNSSGSSVTWAIANQIIDLGEVWVGEGADYRAKQDPHRKMQGGILQRRSHNNQSQAFLPQNAYRSITVNIVPMSEDIVIGPNSAQDDFETVVNALNTQKTTVLIPLYLHRGDGPENGVPPSVINSSTIHEQRLCRSFILGCPDAEIDIDGNDDKYFTSPITFGESPP